MQRLVADYLNLHVGSWRCPGGDGKLFKSKDVSIKWKFITQDSETKLPALRKENLELKKENGSLIERINNLSYILADLQDKAKNAQEEKASLITSIGQLYKDVEVNHPLKDNDLLQVTNNNHVEVTPPLNDNDIDLQQLNKNVEANHLLKDNDLHQVTNNNHEEVNHLFLTITILNKNNQETKPALHLFLVIFSCF